MHFVFFPYEKSNSGISGRGIPLIRTSRYRITQFGSWMNFIQVELLMLLCVFRTKLLDRQWGIISGCSKDLIAWFCLYFQDFIHGPVDFGTHQKDWSFSCIDQYFVATIYHTIQLQMFPNILKSHKSPAWNSSFVIQLKQVRSETCKI